MANVPQVTGRLNPRLEEPAEIRGCRDSGALQAVEKVCELFRFSFTCGDPIVQSRMRAALRVDARKQAE